MLCMNRRRIASHKISIILHTSEQRLPLHNETTSCLGLITQDIALFHRSFSPRVWDYQEVMSHYHCCFCVDAVIGRERCAIVSVRKTMCVREDLALSEYHISITPREPPPLIAIILPPNPIRSLFLDCRCAD